MKNEIAKLDTMSIIIFLSGIIGLAIILVFVLRFGRGLFGIVLAIIAMGLVIYWVFELRKSIMSRLPLKSLPKKQWNYDILDGNGFITLIAEIPGFNEEVQVKLNEKILEITGGKGFKKDIKLDNVVEILSISYINGVLNVKLKKI